MASNRTILIKGDLSRWHDEGRAAEAISPGHLIQLLSAGTYQKNDLVAGNVPLYVAKEDGLQGKTITDAYATNDLVPFHRCQKGDMIHVRIPAAAAAIVKGDRLELVANGVVQKLAAGVAAFQAEEAVDNSAGGAEAFVKASVI